MARLTLEQFRLTRTPCADLGNHPMIGNGFGEDEHPCGFIYVDSCYIAEDLVHDHEGEVEGYSLILCQDEFSRVRTPEGLAELEEILYTQWYLTEIADPELTTPQKLDEETFSINLSSIAQNLKRCRPIDPIIDNQFYRADQKQDYLIRLSQWCDTVMCFNKAYLTEDTDLSKLFLEVSGYKELSS